MMKNSLCDFFCHDKISFNSLAFVIPFWLFSLFNYNAVTERFKSQRTQSGSEIVEQIVLVYLKSSCLKYRHVRNEKKNKYVLKSLLFAQWRDLISSSYQRNRFEWFFPTHLKFMKIISIQFNSIPLSMREHVCPYANIRLMLKCAVCCVLSRAHI